MRAISARISTRSLASRFESGSSIRNACGSRTIARPIATRWRWPPESVRGFFFSTSASPSVRAALVDAPLDLGLRRPRASSARRPCCRRRSCAGRARSSGRPSRRRGPSAAACSRSRRRSEPSPSVIASSPAIIRSAVVLPHPDGPTKTTNSPSAISQVELGDGPRPVRVDLRQLVECDLGHPPLVRNLTCHPLRPNTVRSPVRHA